MYEMEAKQITRNGSQHQAVFQYKDRLSKYMDSHYNSVHENHQTHQTFLMPRPKCLMRDFTNLKRIYKAHQTNVWWIMKVFRLHCYNDKTAVRPSYLYKEVLHQNMSTIHIHFLIRVLSVSHFMGLAKTTNGKPYTWRYIPAQSLTHCGLMTSYGDRSESTLAQVMACCLAASSHYRNQCRFIIS